MSSIFPTANKRNVVFDDDGILLRHSLDQFDVNRWIVSVEPRETCIPSFEIKHIHPDNRNYKMPSLDGPCVCGKTLPKNCISDAVVAVEKSIRTKLYAGIDRAEVGLRKTKSLADDWYLEAVKKEQVLFHVCNINHPAYLYYGRGIPLKYIAWPPYPDTCKTCKTEIPKGIRVALLMMHQKVGMK